MKKLFIMLFVLWAPVCFAVESDIHKVVDGNTEFALDAYHQIRQQAGNIVFSPYSISTALAMTYAGGPRRNSSTDGKGPSFYAGPK